MEIRINSIELASELAHSRTLYESGDICENEDDMFETHEDGTQHYKEEVQDRFFHWYDFYLGEINKYSI